jgi:hypothetical protein
MGMWWNYFDMLGRRVPGRRGADWARWALLLAPPADDGDIGCGCGSIVSLLEHAGDSAPRPPTAWLLAGSVVITSSASVTLALYRPCPPTSSQRGMSRYIAPCFGAAAALVVAIGLIRPPPLGW